MSQIKTATKSDQWKIEQASMRGISLSSRLDPIVGHSAKPLYLPLTTQDTAACCCQKCSTYSIATYLSVKPTTSSASFKRDHCPSKRTYPKLDKAPTHIYQQANLLWGQQNQKDLKEKLLVPRSRCLLRLRASREGWNGKSVLHVDCWPLRLQKYIYYITLQRNLRYRRIQAVAVSSKCHSVNRLRRKAWQTQNMKINHNLNR